MGKKIHELIAGTISNDRLIIIGDPSTGALAKLTIAELKTFLGASKIPTLANTTTLVTKTSTDALQYIVEDYGIFDWASSGTVDNEYVFSANGAGVWILKADIRARVASPSSITLNAISFSQVDVSWSAVSGADAYVLERATNSTFTAGLTTLYSGSLLTFSDTGRTELTTYYYRIRTLKAGFAKSAYLTASITTPSSSAIITANRVTEYKLNEGSGQYALNTLSGNTSQENLLGFPEGNFNNYQYYTQAGYFTPAGSGEATVTENFAPNRDSLNIAARLVTVAGAVNSGATGQIPGLRIDRTIPAGTYTFSAWVKSNTGSSQTCRIEVPVNTLSSDKTITTSWTRIEQSFTVGAEGTIRIAIRNSSAGTAMDILIDGWMINSGSTATAYKDRNWDAVLGYDAFNRVETQDPTWIAGNKGLSFSTNTKGINAWNSQAVSCSNISVHLVCKFTSGTSTQNRSIATPYNDAGFYLMGGYGGVLDSVYRPEFKFRTTLVTADCVKLADDAVHHVVGTYDGANLKLYIDGVLIKTQAAASLAAISINRIIISDTQLSIGHIGEIYWASIYSSAHSETEVNTMYNALSGIMATRGVTMWPKSTFIIWEGDSISRVASAGLLPRTGQRALTVPALGLSLAEVGHTISNVSSRSAQQDAYYNGTKPNNIFHLLIGANDLASVGSSPSAFVAAVKSFCLAKKATGWKVVLGTLLPQNEVTNVGFNSRRNTANSLIRADNSFYDVLADYAADATMGGDSAASNTTYYVDGVHPTAAGHQILGNIAAAAINSILV